MKIHEATEQAYKNGYENGYEDGKRDAVKHGRWVDAYGIRKSKCKNCGVAFGRVMEDCHFCPNCGADMRGTNDE